MSKTNQHYRRKPSSYRTLGHERETQNCILKARKDKILKLESNLTIATEALEFYADENNTVRDCMAGNVCANVDLCKTAQEALRRLKDE